MSTSLAAKPKHPNRLPFEGVLTLVDIPSDRCPNGSRNHRVILTRDAAERALWSLEGMGVNFIKDFDGHDARGKCGVIDKGWIEGDELIVKGHLFVLNFPEILEFVQKRGKEVGMSYELADAHVDNMRTSIWKITDAIFTGAAILLANKAAYGSTRFTLSAAGATEEQEKRFTGKLSFMDRGLKTGRARVPLQFPKPAI